MKINYNLILFIYLPILPLVIINTLKDRFEPQNNNLKLCNWSLLPIIFFLLFDSTAYIIKSFWSANLSTILNKFPYNPSNAKILIIFYYCLSLSLVYLVLHYAYKVRIMEMFNFKFAHFPVVLKICSILGILHILAALGSWKNSFRSLVSDIKLLDTQYIVLILFITIILAPIVEEIVFRGLLYSPLYRKTGRFFAIIISSLVWTYTHTATTFPGIDISAIGIFILGIILAWLYDRTGSLLPPILVHSFQNCWIVVYLLK